MLREKLENLTKNPENIISSLPVWDQQELITGFLMMNRAYVQAQIYLQNFRVNANTAKEEGEFAFWMKNGTNVKILHILIYRFYQGKNIKISQLADDMNVTRSNISQVLKEARQLGLINELNQPLETTLRVAMVGMSELIEDVNFMESISEFVERANILRRKLRHYRQNI